MKRSFKPKNGQNWQIRDFLSPQNPYAQSSILSPYPPFNSTLEMTLQLTVDCRLTHSDLQ